MIRIANGIYKMTFGTPEKFTPVSVLGTDPDNRGLSVLPDNKPPFCEDDIVFSRRKGAITLEIPLDPSEDVYGLGLMLKSFRQTGLKKPIPEILMHRSRSMQRQKATVCSSIPQDT